MCERMDAEVKIQEIMCASLQVRENITEPPKGYFSFAEGDSKISIDKFSKGNKWQNIRSDK